MDTWSFSIEGFDPRNIASAGTRLLCANGYMGLRGAPEEADKAMFPAVTLAGVYDQNGDRWREPVNAPHPLYAQVLFNGGIMALGVREPVSHRQEIGYRSGLWRRTTDFAPVTVSSERFASMAEPHLLAERMTLCFREDGELTFRTGIDADVWDINGPHLTGLRFAREKVLTAQAVTGEKGIAVVSAQACAPDADMEESFEETERGVFRVLRRMVRQGEKLSFSLFAAVFTSLDVSDPAAAARKLCASAAGRGYAACLTAHQAAWERIWQRSCVEIGGSDEAARAMHASQYHLNCVAPRHADDMSIPARGLSGQTYKGAIFWDSEMFFFPMFVYTQPEIARSLLRYRLETLPGALKKAREYGYRGAFYPWESQEGGEEGCTNFNVVDVFTHRPVRTYFRDKQIHISADIVFALRRYYEITGDRTLLEEGGARVILECARFYLSRAGMRLDRTGLDYPDVIGPDEYHERVNNNAFTNRMIRHCMETALMLEDIFSDRPARFQALLCQMGYEQDWERLKTAVRQIRRPRERDGVIEQFDGYFDLEDCSLDTVRSRLCDPREYWGGDHGVAGPTQIIKQADVIAMLALFPEDCTDAQADTNYTYYEPRTEHGSSLSACMYALTACRLGRLDEAWELFLRTASIDVTGGGKEWAGEIYIGGTHPASNGGAWMIAALGFAGLRMRNGQPRLDPHLPRQLHRLRFPITAGEKRFIVDIRREGEEVVSSMEEEIS